MMETFFPISSTWPAEFPCESPEMWCHLATAQEHCMLNPVCEQLFQPQILVIA